MPLPQRQARSLGSFLEAVVSGLRGGQLRFRLGPLGFHGQGSGLAFGDQRVQLRSRKFHQQLALFHEAAAVHQDALHVAGLPGVQLDLQVGLEFRRKIDHARHGLRDYGHDLGSLRGVPQAVPKLLEPMTEPDIKGMTLWGNYRPNTLFRVARLTWAVASIRGR